MTSIVLQAVVWWLVLLVLSRSCLASLDLQGWKGWRYELADTIMTMITCGVPVWLVSRHWARHQTAR